MGNLMKHGPSAGRTLDRNQPLAPVVDASETTIEIFHHHQTNTLDAQMVRQFVGEGACFRLIEEGVGETAHRKIEARLPNSILDYAVVEPTHLEAVVGHGGGEKDVVQRDHDHGGRGQGGHGDQDRASPGGWRRLNLLFEEVVSFEELVLSEEELVFWWARLGHPEDGMAGLSPPDVDESVLDLETAEEHGGIDGEMGCIRSEPVFRGGVLEPPE